MSSSLLLSSPLSFAGNAVSRKILPTPEAFSWLKLFKGMGYEMGFFVDPSGHVLLPLCIISTRSPHLVCKIHAFKTNMGEGGNEKARAQEKREEMARMAWLQQRADAFDNEREALRQGITIRDYIEQKGRVYDEEFDQQLVNIGKRMLTTW